MSIKNWINKKFGQEARQIKKEAKINKLKSELIESIRTILTELNELFSAPTYLSIVQNRFPNIQKLLIEDSCRNYILQIRNNPLVPAEDYWLFEILSEIYKNPNQYPYLENCRSMVFKYIYSEVKLKDRKDLDTEVLIRNAQFVLCDTDSAEMALMNDLRALIVDYREAKLSDEPDFSKKTDQKQDDSQNNNTQQIDFKKRSINRSLLSKLIVHNIQNKRLLQKYLYSQSTLKGLIVSIAITAALLLFILKYSGFYILTDWLKDTNSFVEIINLVNSNMVLLEIMISVLLGAWIIKKLFRTIRDIIDYRKVISSFAYLVFVERLDNNDLLATFQVLYGNSLEGKKIYYDIMSAHHRYCTKMGLTHLAYPVSS